MCYFISWIAICHSTAKDPEDEVQMGPPEGSMLVGSSLGWSRGWRLCLSNWYGKPPTASQ
jgi:hypothetical protein